MKFFIEYIIIFLQLVSDPYLSYWCATPLLPLIAPIKGHIPPFKVKYEKLIGLIQQSMSKFAGIVTRNSYTVGKFVLDRLLHPIVNTTPSNMRAYIVFIKFLNKLYKSGGLPFVVIYLKGCSVLLQQSVAGKFFPSQSLNGVAIALTRGGLPRIIPIEMRSRIRARDAKVVRMWLTLFGMYRVLEIPGLPKLSTITDHGKDFDISKMIEIRDKFYHYLLRTNKSLSSFVLGQSDVPVLKASPFLIGKASPMSRHSLHLKFKDKRSGLIREESSFWNYSSTAPKNVVLSALALKSDKVILPLFEEWCNLTKNNDLLNWFNKLLKQFDAPTTLKFELGKLGFKLEPAGKVRVFAMVECWTQWILRPLHDMLFNILSEIQQDGTFDQHRPIHLLYKEMFARNGWHLYSFDLSAATDRLPVTVQEKLLEPILGTRLAALWRGLLTWRGYKAESEQFSLNTTLYYSVGQPMGALSSWAMLALTHHFIVQWASYNARRDETLPFTWFTLYAVLGDDIVISDKDVAAEYVKLMAFLGVDINLTKSLVSSKRVCEFAKTYWIPEQASPLPFKEFLIIERNSSVLIEYARKFCLTLPDIFHTLGYGYKVKSGLYTKRLSKMGVRVARLLVSLTAPGSLFGKSLKDWLTMDSLVKSTDHSNWDRISQSLIDRELPIIIQRLENLMMRLSPYIETNFAFERGVGRIRNKKPWSPAAMKALKELDHLQTEKIFGPNYEQREITVEETMKILSSTADPNKRPRGLDWVVDPSLKIGETVKGGKSVESYSTLAEPFSIDLRDLKEMGFTGNEKTLKNDLFGGLYREGVVSVFLELSKLRKELLRLKDKLKDPSLWYSFEFDGKTLDSFELLEYLWAKLEAYKDTLSNYPTYEIIRARELNFFDPSIKKSKVWSKIRGIGLRKPLKQELSKVESSKTEQTT